MTSDKSPTSPGLPEWFAKPHRHPDYCDPCCDDVDAIIKWKIEHVELLEKLVKDLAARSIPAPSPVEGQRETGLVWTTAKPTVDGDYQFRYGPHHPRVFVAVEKVERYGGGMFVWNERNECHEAIGGDTWNGEWAGPIPQPSPTKGTENTPSHPADQ